MPVKHAKNKTVGTSKQALEQALHLHRLGKLPEAEQAYRNILLGQPNHADAMHLLGMLLHQIGKFADARQLIQMAIALQPKQAVYHSNLGIVLAAEGQTAAAIDAYRQAARLNPQSAEAINNLGVALHESGEVTQAMACFERALSMQPDYPDVRTNLARLYKIRADVDRQAAQFESALQHYQNLIALQPGDAEAQHLLGDLLHQMGRSADAVHHYRKSLLLNPKSAETENNLGNALFASGRKAEALGCYERALAKAPQFPQACNNLGNAMKEAGRLAEAIEVYRYACLLQPRSPVPLSNLGNALRETGQWESAMDCYQKALALAPDHPDTHNNIGNAYCERGDWHAAVEAYEQCLWFSPGSADAINNLGAAVEELGQRDRAMELYQRARLLAPDAISPPWNIALLQLLRGDYENGWPGYEHRWKQKQQSRAIRLFSQPMLTLNPPANSRVLLHAEQGFGDAIQFIRYLPMVISLGVRVILECPPALVRLFANLQGVEAVIAREQPLPEFDLHCPLMSLPMLFGTRLSTIPSTIPYLFAEEKLIARWKQKFAAQPVGLRVGLAWAGQPTHQKNRHRSMSLSAFAALATVPNVRFYSLQIGEAGAQAKSPPDGMSLTNWTADITDFAATAAIISQLDLVITVDTAISHLAGAMGKPVWILLAFQPDWRWLLDREDSPWYPTARLFRQTKLNDWAAVIEKIRDALETSKNETSKNETSKNETSNSRNNDE